MDTSFLKNLSFNELTDLLREAEQVAREKNPTNIALAKRQEAMLAARQLDDELREVKMKRIISRLKSFLKPGMKLKMKGCKDGKGLREFIKWDDNDNLVCWQITLKRQYNQTGRREGGVFSITETETKTHQVTTHMANKVQMIQFVAGGQLVPLKKLIG